MKKYFGITGVVLSLLAPSTSLAGFRLGSKPKPVQRSSQSNSSGRDYSAKPAQTADVQNVSCDKGNSVTYDFISAISGGEITYDKRDDGLVISIPEYFEACIGNISIDSNVGPYNNVYVKFKVEPTEAMKNAEGSSLEHKYENCIKTNYGNIKSWEDADKAGLIARNKFSKRISLNNVDSKRDSEVIIASPNKVYGYDQQVFSGSLMSLPSSSDSEWNCMRFEDPSTKPVMANKTETYQLREEAVLLCQSDNPSLADVDAQLAKLRDEDTAGNYQYLIKLLEEIKDKLLEEDADKMVARLAEIEEEFAPSDEDLEEGRNIGVSKSEAKKLAKEYAGLMKKFSEEMSPAIANELEALLKERSDATDKRIEVIDKRIAKLNEITTGFSRQTGDGQENFKVLVRGLEKNGLKSSARSIFKAVTKAKYLSKVYVGDEDERGKPLKLSEAIKKASDSNKKLSREVFARWDDEKALRSGSDAPIKRRQKIAREIQNRGKKDYTKFQANLGQYDKYMSDYTNRMIKHYCTSGGDMQKCQYMQQQYAPYLMNQYNQYKTKKSQNYGQYWSNKYGKAMSQQDSILRKYEGIHQQAQFDIMQRKMDNDFSSGFGSSTGNDFEFWVNDDYSSSTGFNFGNDFSMQPPQFSPGGGPQQAVPYDMRSPASGNQSGSGIFSNPYYRGR